MTVANRRPCSSHRCPGCARQVENSRFACPACWGRLPRELREPITDNYLVNPGAHLEAMTAACNWYQANRPAMPDEERCETTELLVDQCGCREHRGGADPDEETRRLRARLLAQPGWLAARWGGTCGCCGEGFPAGTAIHADTQRGWRAECCASDGGDRG